jgi:RNA polymerase sigma-70 factor, ECF subfamily
MVKPPDAEGSRLVPDQAAIAAAKAEATAVTAGEPETGDLRLIARDPEAFEAFYRLHVVTVTRFVARRVADPHTVADLTAEVFLAVIDSAHTYRPGRGSPRAWLYGIARNVIAGESRRAAAELGKTSRLAGRRLLADDDIARLEDRIDAESAARDLYRALTRLPAAERAVLELVAVDGLPVNEAAAALRIRPGTARVRLHRARRAVQDALGPPGAPITTPITPTSSATSSTPATSASPKETQ